MKILERFEVRCSPEEVWALIRDPREIAACVPSVQSIEVLDERHYKAIIKQRIGFISATFEIRTEIVEENAPNRLVLANSGRTVAGAAGHMRSVDTITLTAMGDGRTEVSLESELRLGGQLAVLGARLIELKSKEVVAATAANLKQRLERTAPYGTEKL